jgi:hypothetical protein
MMGGIRAQNTTPSGDFCGHSELGHGLCALVEASIPARSRVHATCVGCGERFRLPRRPRSRWCATCRPIERGAPNGTACTGRAKMPATGRRACESCGHPYRAARSLVEILPAGMRTKGLPWG